jgi:hypothetical protein
VRVVLQVLPQGVLSECFIEASPSPKLGFVEPTNPDVLASLPEVSAVTVHNCRSRLWCNCQTIRRRASPRRRHQSRSVDVSYLQWGLFSSHILLTAVLNRLVPPSQIAWIYALFPYENYWSLQATPLLIVACSCCIELLEGPPAGQPAVREEGIVRLKVWPSRMSPGICLLLWADFCQTTCAERISRDASCRATFCLCTNASQ